MLSELYGLHKNYSCQWKKLLKINWNDRCFSIQEVRTICNSIIRWHPKNKLIKVWTHNQRLHHNIPSPVCFICWLILIRNPKLQWPTYWNIMFDSLNPGKYDIYFKGIFLKPAITRTSIDQVLWHHMASIGHSGLKITLSTSNVTHRSVTWVNIGNVFYNMCCI